MMMGRDMPQQAMVTCGKGLSMDSEIQMFVSTPQSMCFLQTSRLRISNKASKLDMVNSSSGKRETKS